MKTILKLGTVYQWRKNVGEAKGAETSLPEQGKINCNRMVAKLYPMSFEILICLLIRYHLLFAVHVDLNSKKVIDSHLILEE